MLQEVSRAIEEWKHGILQDPSESRALSALPNITRFYAQLSGLLNPHPLLFSCVLCTKSFVSQRKLDAHVDLVHHKAVLECRVCGKIYIDRACFNRHANTHLVECLECNKEFANKNLFDAHKC